MEERAGSDHIALAGEGDAAFADNLFEVLDRLEIGVDQRLIYELPKMLRRLQFGTVRRLKGGSGRFVQNCTLSEACVFNPAR